MAGSTRYLELEIESLAAGGKGVARHNGKVVFVRGGFPGDKVLARVVKKRREWNDAVVEHVITKSPDRVEPLCSNADICGGCPWMVLDYSAQLKAKEKIVRDCLERIGKIENPPIEPIMACDETLGYRNKMEFSFSTRAYRRADERVDTSREEDVISLGLHAPGSFFRVVPVNSCLLQKDNANKLLSVFRDVVGLTDKPAYDARNATGFWRFCIIRTTLRNDGLMLYYITTERDEAVDDLVVREVKARCPEVTTIISGVSKSVAGVARAESSRVLLGDGTIEEVLDGTKFRISPESFFQTIPAQAEKMLRFVAELAGPGDGKFACDLYAGGGIISFYLAAAGYRVLAFESSPDAVSDGQFNAAISGIDMVALRVVDLADKAGWASIGDIDLITVDPPRAGIHPEAMKGILNVSPSRIIMVSCNPPTLARDLEILINAGYDLVTVKPVDMFPHTHHIETVAFLEKNRRLNLRRTDG